MHLGLFKTLSNAKMPHFDFEATLFNTDKLNELIQHLNYKNNSDLANDLNLLGLDITEEAIKKWRRGETVPKTNALSALAQHFGVTELDFFYDLEKKKEEITRSEIKKDPNKYIDILVSSLEKIDYSDALLDKLKEARES